MDKPSVITAGLAGSALGALFYNVMPLYLGMAQEYRELSNEQIGLMGSIFFLGFNVFTITAFFWILRVNWRLVSGVATMVAALSIGAGALLQSYQLLLIAIFIGGGAFSILYGVSASVLGESPNSARWFGVKIAAESGTGVLLVMLLPSLVIAGHGFNGMSLALTAIIAVFVPIMMWMPRRPTQSVEERPPGPDTDLPSSTPVAASLIMLAAVAFSFCGQTIMWSFVERMGSAAGFDPESVSTVLAVALGFSFLGAGMAAVLGNRFGTAKPFIATFVVYLAAVSVLLNSTEYSAYFIGAMLLLFSAGSGMAYAFSNVSALDQEGRYTVLMAPAIGLGAMVGPGIAGYLSTGGNYTPMLVFGAIVVVTAGVLVVISAELARKSDIVL